MSEWISVEADLPPLQRTVLLFKRAGSNWWMTTGHRRVILSDEKGTDWAWDSDVSQLGEVTHWMPLPPPPEENSNAD